MNKKTGPSKKSGASKSVKDLRPRAAKENTAKGVRGGLSDISATKIVDSRSSSLSSEALVGKQAKSG